MSITRLPKVPPITGPHFTRAVLDVGHISQRRGPVRPFSSRLYILLRRLQDLGRKRVHTSEREERP